LGTIIVAALAKQLDARVEIMRSQRGTTVSVAHGTPGFRSRMPEKASRQRQTAVPFDNRQDAVRAEVAP
jgi:hypothetical protein